MHVALIGPGAVGSVVAAALFEQDRHSVVLCARTPFEMLRVVSSDGERCARPTFLADSRTRHPVDFVLVAVKTYDSTKAALWFPVLVNSATKVAVLQNGVEHVERWRSFVPSNAIVPVVVNCPAERSSPGCVRLRGPAQLTVAGDELGREFAQLFEGTSLRVETSASIATDAWRKLCLNAAGAARPLVRSQPAGGRSLEEVTYELARETVQVAQAEGASLELGWAHAVARDVLALPLDRVTSLEADLLRGGPNEIDARNGAVVRIGARHGIAAPFNALVVARLGVK